MHRGAGRRPRPAHLESPACDLPAPDTAIGEPPPAATRRPRLFTHGFRRAIPSVCAPRRSIGPCPRQRPHLLPIGPTVVIRADARASIATARAGDRPVRSVPRRPLPPRLPHTPHPTSPPDPSPVCATPIAVAQPTMRARPTAHAVRACVSLIALRSDSSRSAAGHRTVRLCRRRTGDGDANRLPRCVAGRGHDPR